MVQAREILRMIERGEDVKIEKRVIKGDLDLSELALEKVHVERDQVEINMDVDEYAKCVNSSIKIKNCVIEGSVNFSGAIFQNVVRFDDVTFHGNVEFKGSKFYKEISFLFTQFNGRANFDYADSYHRFVFISVNFSGIARFSSAHFEGVAQFTGATFGDNAIFIGSQFHADAIFGSSQFKAYAHFGSAQFERDANFSNVIFGKYLDFTAAKFKKNLNLNGSKIADMKLHTKLNSDSKIILNGSNFARLFVRWSWIKDQISYDEAVYLALVKNFETLGLSEDADDCYFQYRKISQHKKNWYVKEKRRLHRFNWLKLYDHVAWRFCGYGVRPSFTLAWVFGLVFGFGILYSSMDKLIIKTIILDFIKIRTLTKILFICNVSKFDYFDSYLTSVLDQTYNALIKNIYYIGDSLYLSAMIFTGQTPIDVQPVGGWKYAVMSESVLGYLFLALFIVVLTKKLIR